jgi:hypothetical protein
MTVAYAWASGLIEFGRKCPDGALPIMRGKRSEIEPIVSAKARHSYERGVLLVPGVPEADTPEEAVDAFTRFCWRCEGSAI